ncbi:hypothetical protein EX30DRAFT_372291 [Ascodesmis nigricans]|uniref:Uncharacterized protein n=1 Tax=Ascodesmis nigricans TaxID=341454 RepID=A0A4S2MUR6_9PEZI|nr:hypothetical protein EX30DRAFT_372291 [Ascodesmis nigricans]
MGIPLWNGPSKPNRSKPSSSSTTATNSSRHHYRRHPRPLNSTGGNGVLTPPTFPFPIDHVLDRPNSRISRRPWGRPNFAEGRAARSSETLSELLRTAPRRSVGGIETSTRVGGDVVDGLGDRERSLSPGAPNNPWDRITRDYGLPLYCDPASSEILYGPRTVHGDSLAHPMENRVIVLGAIPRSMNPGAPPLERLPGESDEEFGSRRFWATWNGGLREIVMNAMTDAERGEGDGSNDINGADTAANSNDDGNSNNNNNNNNNSTTTTTTTTTSGNNNTIAPPELQPPHSAVPLPPFRLPSFSETAAILQRGLEELLAAEPSSRPNRDQESSDDDDDDEVGDDEEMDAILAREAARERERRRRRRESESGRRTGRGEEEWY